MKQIRFLSTILLLICCSISRAQQPVATDTTAVVPPLMNFAGVLTDSSISLETAVTFLLYKEPQGGSPVWMESQKVKPDSTGHYSVMLGATSSQGLPAEIFVAGQAHWLAVQVQDQEEQPRVLLVSAPYALKALDAQTIGGLPPSAFVLASPSTSSAATGSTNTAVAGSTVLPPASSNVTTTGGAANTIPLFTTATNIQNSILTQTGTTAISVGGKLNLPAMGTATATLKFNSRPETMVASTYNSGTSAAIAQTFQLQAEPVGSNTTSPSGTLNVLYGSGTATPAETGLKISNKGLITFASGQTFPGTGSGTVSSVAIAAPASDFTVSGSPVTGKGTLNLAWNVLPTTANTANAIVKRDASGNFTASNITVSGMTASGVISAADLRVVDGSSGAILIRADATASSGGGTGIIGITNSGDYGSVGVLGMAGSLTCCSEMGVEGYAGNGLGVYGQNYTSSNEGTGTTNAGVWGDSSAGVGVVGTSDTNIGVLGKSAGSDGVHGVSHTNQGSGVAGVNDATNGTGVYGSDINGYGFVTDSHVSQARVASGWAKAMAFVDPNNSVSPILVCFNSQIPGSQASTPPCGMTFYRPFSGDYYIDFGFQVNDRFVLMTPIWTDVNPTAPHVLTVCRYGSGTCPAGSPTQVAVFVDNNSPAADSAFYIVVF